MNPKKQNPARARCGAVAGSHSGAKSTVGILAQSRLDVNAHPGGFFYGELADWLDLEAIIAEGIFGEAKAELC